MSNTKVDKKDLPQAPQPVLVNAPKKLKPAIVRIMQLETALEDLSRAVEIAQYSGQFNLTESFRTRADELLQTKILIEQPESDFKLTILTDNKTDAEAERS
jgi:hypothetical protein